MPPNHFNRYLFVGIALAVVAGLIVYSFVWGAFSPYPTWIETSSGENGPKNSSEIKLRLAGRAGSGEDGRLEIRCERHQLKVLLNIGVIDRIGSGEAGVSVSEFFVDDADGNMTGKSHEWALPERGADLERDEPAGFIRQLARHPWFIASAPGLTRFHVAGLENYLPGLDKACNYNDLADAEDANTIMDAITSGGASYKKFQVYFDYAEPNLTVAGDAVVQAAVDAIRNSRSHNVIVIGHADTLEADPEAWTEEHAACLRVASSHKEARADLACQTASMTARRLAHLRANSVSRSLIKFGIPDLSLTVISAGADDQAVETGPKTREVMNRRVTIIVR
jgi:outer membrane protein OmpA-like peptidoglycan-associated protein